MITDLPDFIQIPAILIKDRKLHQLDWLVYGVVYFFTKMKLQKCILSNAGIAVMVHSTPGSVANSLSRLKSRHYVKIVLEKRTRKEIIPLVFYRKKV
jgi:hypothetical protein